MEYTGPNRRGPGWTAQDIIAYGQGGNPGPRPPGRTTSPSTFHNPIRSPLNRNRFSSAFNTYNRENPPVPARSVTPASPQPVGQNRYSSPAPPANPPPSHGRVDNSRQDGKRPGLLEGGWRAGVTYSALAATLVFLTNLGLTIYVGWKYRTVGGLGTIYEGRCDKTKKYGTWIHLAINCCATILLSASNYTMQCLSAPTRREVDREHARKRWLDIGVSSLRNLHKLSGGRIALWWFLGLSSVPLHLVYNSAIFSSLSTNAYVVDVVAVDAIDTYLHNATAIGQLSLELGIFNKINKTACMEAYGRQFIPDRRDVLVIIDHADGYHHPEQHGLHTAGTNTNRTPYDWICDSVAVDHSVPCDINNALIAIDTWKMNGGEVLYCLSEEMDEKCSLQYSLHIMIVVIIFNVVKAICMIITVKNSKGDPLVTIGDAISSFMEKEDRTTLGMCIATKRGIKRGDWGSVDDSRPKGPHKWYFNRAFWFRAASVRRWMLCIILSLISIAAALYLTIYGVKNSNDFRMIWKLGFGNVNIHALADVTDRSNRDYKGILKSIMIANVPQTIFSTIYLLYNSIFTCMLLSDEWDRFATERRPLRVTSPREHQRSTYFLHLPYRYSVPLLVGSALMHWLISQSIFLARVIEFKDGQETTDSISTTGYSPSAVICATALATLMLLVVILMGFRRYSGKMPLASSCSAAISAACHPGAESQESTGQLKWGVLHQPVGNNAGHCTFTSQAVTLPQTGYHYTGHATSSGRELREEA